MKNNDTGSEKSAGPRVQDLIGLVRDAADCFVSNYDCGEWTVKEYLPKGCGVFEISSIEESFEFGTYKILLDTSKKLSHSSNLFVKPEYRGDGLGRDLAELWEALCAQLGIKKIVINQNENYSFWEHMGYKKIGGLHRNWLELRGVPFDYEKNFEPPVYKRIKLVPDIN